MIDDPEWSTAKSRSEAYWETRRQQAEQRAMQDAARRGWQLYNRRMERRNVENIPGRVMDSLRDPSTGNVLANGAANLRDAFDFVGETFRENVLGQSLDPVVRPRKPVPMPTQRPPQRTGTMPA